MASDSHVCIVDGKRHDVPLGNFMYDGGPIRNVCTLHQQMILQMYVQSQATPDDFNAVTTFLGLTSASSLPAA